MIAAPPATETFAAIEKRIEHHAERIRRLDATVRALARLPADAATKSVNDTVLMSSSPTPLDTPLADRTLPVMDDADLLEAAANAGGSAVVALDGRGAVRFWNPAAVELFGWPADDVLGDPPPFLPSDKVVEHAGMIRAVHARGIGKERTTIRRRSDGSLVAVRALASPSRCGGVVFSYRDAADPAAEREPANGGLIALGRAAAGVVHDFHNLLSVIQAHAEILRESIPFDVPIRDSAEAIIGAAELAAGVTRNLLDSVRPGESSPSRVDVNLHLGRLDRVLRSIVGARVKVHLSPGSSVGTAALEPAALTQIALNLAVNARDAMPDGGTLHVRTAAHGDSQVVLTVADTGQGMDEATRVRIFDPFFSTRSAGTGLGLTIVREAVAKAGGRVEVESSPDWGTQVRVFLPRA